LAIDIKTKLELNEKKHGQHPAVMAERFNAQIPKP
jgi:hypothetical protein